MDDIDLFTGGIAERELHGALVGPTFGCLLGMQFQALRRCDRFWFETDNAFVRFTPEQLAEIGKTQLSKVVCQNGDNILMIQKHAMDMHDSFLWAFIVLYLWSLMIGSYRNPRIACKSIEEMNLWKWRDTSKTCRVAGRTLSLGKHRRISPCMNCACTAEGVLCRSIKVDQCATLLASFARPEIESDEACMVQCAFAMSSQQLNISMRSIMHMLSWSCNYFLIIKASHFVINQTNI